MTDSTALTTTTSNNQALAFLHDGAALDHPCQRHLAGLRRRDHGAERAAGVVP